MADSDAPKSHIKEYVALITALTALVAGVAAVVKPQDESGTKASYETLSKALQEATEASAQNHDDIVALRSYIEGVMAHQKGAPVATKAVGNRPRVRAGAVAAKPPSVAPDMATLTLDPNLAPHPVEPGPLLDPEVEAPPVLHNRPPVFQAPQYETLR